MLILWGLWSCFPEIWISQDILSPSLVRSSNHFIGCSCMLMWIPLVCGRTNIEAGRRAEWLVGGFNLFQNCPKVSKGTGQMGWIMTYRELSNQYYIIANDRDFGMQYLLSLHDSFEVTAGTSQHSKSWDFRSFNGIIFGNFYHRFTIVLRYINSHILSGFYGAWSTKIHITAILWYITLAVFPKKRTGLKLIFPLIRP